MKKLLIPLLAATALLGGCHRTTVRHTVEVPVAVTEHRHVHNGVVIVHHHEGDSRTHHHDHYPPSQAPRPEHRSIDYREVHVYSNGTQQRREAERRHNSHRDRVIVTPAPTPRRDSAFGHALRDSLEKAENRHKPADIGDNTRYHYEGRQSQPRRERVYVTPVPVPHRKEPYGHAVRESLERAENHDIPRRDHATLPGNGHDQGRTGRGANNAPRHGNGERETDRTGKEHHDDARLHRMSQPVPVPLSVSPQRDRAAQPTTHRRDDRPDTTTPSHKGTTSARPVRNIKGKPDKTSSEKSKRHNEHRKSESETDDGRHEKRWQDR